MAKTKYNVKKSISKPLCSKPTTKGHCKNKAIKGKPTCYFHSLSNEDLCGQNTKDFSFCKQYKGKCKVHDNYKAEKKLKSNGNICVGSTRDGKRCSKLSIYDSNYCSIHSIKPIDYCGAKLSKSDKTCMIHKDACVLHKSFTTHKSVESDSDSDSDQEVDVEENEDESESEAESQSLSKNKKKNGKKVDSVNQIYKYLQQVSDDDSDSYSYSSSDE